MLILSLLKIGQVSNKEKDTPFIRTTEKQNETMKPVYREIKTEYAFLFFVSCLIF